MDKRPIDELKTWIRQQNLVFAENLLRIVDLNSIESIIDFDVEKLKNIRQFDDKQREDVTNKILA